MCIKAQQNSSLFCPKKYAFQKYFCAIRKANMLINQCFRKKDSHHNNRVPRKLVLKEGEHHTQEIPSNDKSLMENRKWKVVKFSEGHSHAGSTPHKVHFLRSHREVSSHCKSLIDSFGQ